MKFLAGSNSNSLFKRNLYNFHLKSSRPHCKKRYQIYRNQTCLIFKDKCCVSLKQRFQSSMKCGLNIYVDVTKCFLNPVNFNVNRTLTRQQKVKFFTLKGHLATLIQRNLNFGFNLQFNANLPCMQVSQSVFLILHTLALTEI